MPNFFESGPTCENRQYDIATNAVRCQLRYGHLGECARQIHTTDGVRWEYWRNEMKKKSVMVPEHLIAKVQELVEGDGSQIVPDPVEERLNAAMQKYSLEWVNVKITYKEIPESKIEVFINTIGIKGWSLAALGPTFFIVRNKIGGRDF